MYISRYNQVYETKIYDPKGGIIMFRKENTATATEMVSEALKLSLEGKADLHLFLEKSASFDKNDFDSSFYLNNAVANALQEYGKGNPSAVLKKDEFASYHEYINGMKKLFIGIALIQASAAGKNPEYFEALPISKVIGDISEYNFSMSAMDDAAAALKLTDEQKSDMINEFKSKFKSSDAEVTVPAVITDASEAEVVEAEVVEDPSAETADERAEKHPATDTVTECKEELPDFSKMSVKDIKRWAGNKENKLLRDLAIKNGALPVKVCAMKDRDLEIWMKKKKSSPAIEEKSEEKKDTKKPLVNEDMRCPDLRLDPVASAVIAPFPVPITEKNPEKMHRYCEHLHNIAEWALNVMRYSSFNIQYTPLFGVMLEGDNAFIDENNFSLSEVFAEYDGVTYRYKNSADYAQEGKFFQNVRIDVRNGEYFVVVNGTETKLVPCAA